MINKLNFQFWELSNKSMLPYLIKSWGSNVDPSKYSTYLAMFNPLRLEELYPLYMSRKLFFFNAWLFTDLELKETSKLIKFCPVYNNPLYTKDYIFLLKFFQFFRRYNFDFNIIYYLLDSKYNYLWNIILVINTKKLYYQFLINIIKEYKKLWKFFNESKKLIYPSNYLTNFSSKYTISTSLEQGFSINNIFLLNRRVNNIKYLSPILRTHIFWALHTSSFQKIWKKGFGLDYSMSMYTIHFLRVQRRYNKRRYSKVRVSSRPSYFSGICLGSLFISCFWGGTNKSVDWYITTPFVINMNLVITLMIIITSIRVMIIEYNIDYFHNFAKIRIYRFLKTMLNNKIVKNILKFK